MWHTLARFSSLLTSYNGAATAGTEARDTRDPSLNRNEIITHLAINLKAAEEDIQALAVLKTFKLVRLLSSLQNRRDTH